MLDRTDDRPAVIAQGLVFDPPAAELELTSRLPITDNVSKATIRKRRERWREARGLESYELVLPRDRTIEALLDAGRLTEALSLNKARVEIELGKIIAEWAMARNRRK